MEQIVNDLSFYTGLLVVNAVFAGAYLGMMYEFRRSRRILQNEIKVFEKGVKAINDSNDKMADIQQEVSNVKMYVQSTNSMRFGQNGNT
jgi:hypothetical protein